jgi:hypothetical protein
VKDDENLFDLAEGEWVVEVLQVLIASNPQVFPFKKAKKI